VAFLGPLAALAAVAGVLALARALRGRERAAVRALVLAAAIALVPAAAYGHFSPRTSMLASAFVALLAARALRRRPACLAVFVLALGCVTFDECRYWREGAARSRTIVRAAADGEPVDPPQHHHKLVPLFPGRETLETALRVFPAGPP
jgi:hypothetical protein